MARAKVLHPTALGLAGVVLTLKGGGLWSASGGAGCASGRGGGRWCGHGSYRLRSVLRLHDIVNTFLWVVTDSVCSDVPYSRRPSTSSAVHTNSPLSIADLYWRSPPIYGRVTGEPKVTHMVKIQCTRKVVYGSTFPENRPVAFACSQWSSKKSTVSAIGSLVLL